MILTKNWGSRRLLTALPLTAVSAVTHVLSRPMKWPP
jgi:hypothetical protein